MLNKNHPVWFPGMTIRDVFGIIDQLTHDLDEANVEIARLRISIYFGAGIGAIVSRMTSGSTSASMSAIDPPPGCYGEPHEHCTPGAHPGIGPCKVCRP